MLKINTSQDQTLFLETLVPPHFWCRGELNYPYPVVSFPVLSCRASLLLCSHLFNPQFLLEPQHPFPCLVQLSRAGAPTTLELSGC